MAKLYNLARVTTATTGTGTITLGSAVSGYLTFALAGVANGEVVSYGIKDGANSEVGTGTYTSSGTTLTRTVTKSTNSDAAINLSGTAEVYITARKEDFLNSADPLTSSQVAAQSDQETATSTTLAVTPGRQQFHPSAAKCWAHITYSAGTPTLAANYNITSITDTAVGVVTLTIATDFSSANWSPAVTSNVAVTDASATRRTGAPAAGSIALVHLEGGSLADPTSFSFQGFGDQ